MKSAASICLDRFPRFPRASGLGGTPTSCSVSDYSTGEYQHYLGTPTSVWYPLQCCSHFLGGWLPTAIRGEGSVVCDKTKTNTNTKHVANPQKQEFRKVGGPMDPVHATATTFVPKWVDKAGGRLQIQMSRWNKWWWVVKTPIRMSLRDKTNGRDGADESVWRPFQASLHSPPLSLMSDTLPLTRVSKSFAALSKNQTLIQMKRAFCHGCSCTVRHDRNKLPFLPSLNIFLPN